MKLKFSSLILLVFAVVLAGSAALVARSMLRPAIPERVVAKAEQAKPEPSLVLVAAQDINPGDFIDGGAVVWGELDESAVRAGHITGRGSSDRRTQEKKIFGATVRRALQKGEPVSQDMLLYPGSPGFIAAVLAPGMRAISIPTSAVTSNAGLVSAGDWVDVILSIERDEAREVAMQTGSGGVAYNNLAAQTILRRVRVLALNSSTESIAPAYAAALEEESADKKRAAASQTPRRMVFETITLEVSPEEAERLAVAREVGSLQVVLRGVKDPANMEAESAQVTRLQDATAIFSGKAKVVTQVQTFHGSKTGMLSF